MNTYRSGDAVIHVDAQEPRSSKAVPALLLLHGSGGAASYWTARIAPMLYSAGFALYAPHYFEKTGTQRATVETILDGRHFPLWLQAARDAIGYVATRPPVDAKRIGIIGLSLGGYLATALAIDDARVRAAVELSGGVPPGWADKLTSKTAPMLILHGEQDTVVPVAEARRLHSLLEAKSVPSRMELFPSETHWFSPQAQVKMLMIVAQFLSSHLQQR